MTDTSTSTSEGIDAQSLQSLIKRIMTKMEEIDEHGEDLAEIYKEVKSNGFEVKIVRRVVAALRNKEAFEEEQQMFELYMENVENG